MKIIDVSDAVGTVLGQDLTRIVPGEFKGVAFKKGHIIKESDLPLLRSMGKNHIYVLEIPQGHLHENDAASQLALAAVCPDLEFAEAAEGKVNVRAACCGLLKVDSERLLEINMLGGIALSTLHNDSPVQPGELVASVKVIPLTLPGEAIQAAQHICAGQPVLKVVPLAPKKAGLIITGSEVYNGLIEDKFEAVIKNKFAAFGSQVTKTVFLPDDARLITDTIRQLATENDIVFVTGGMSVDPDDVTPSAIRQTGAAVEVYGTPVLPGAMFMLAYLDAVTVMGIPACGMFSKITILDVVLPKVLVGDTITRRDIAALGHGGLCRQCTDGCHYPHCSLGK